MRARWRSFCCARSLYVVGRNGDVRSSRIRPAVGDQKGGITESKANISPENDDDWIKISEYVKKLNPTILDDSTTALNRRKWRGEGVQQAVFEQPCVHAVSSLTIACSSDTMGVRVSALLSSLLGAGGTSGDALQCGGLLFKVQPMATDWVRSLRASMCKQPDKARFEALEFAVHTSLDTLQQTCAEREVAFEQEGDVTCLLTPSTLKPGGLMSQMGLALSKDVDSGSPRFSVRVLDEVAPCAPAQATAVPRDDVAMEVRVKEIVFGSEWQEHGPFEVCIYAHTHTPKLTQHTHSHTHTHTPSVVTTNQPLVSHIKKIVSSIQFGVTLQKFGVGTRNIQWF